MTQSKSVQKVVDQHIKFNMKTKIRDTPHCGVYIIINDEMKPGYHKI